MKKLNVFSYNIHKGFAWGNKKFTLREIRRELRTLHPDLIFLQEVHGHHSGHKIKHPGWPDGSQFEYLAEEIWPHFTYGKNAVYTEGHHGNAILSKFPIVFAENTDISENRFEHRGLLHTVIKVPQVSEPLHALCVHLALLEADRRKQVRKIVRYIHEKVPAEAPVLIAGDFNDWLRKASKPFGKQVGLKETFLSLYGHYPKTFPSFFPLLQLDRIYFRHLRPLRANCLKDDNWVTLSDHLPLEAEFQL